MSAGKPGPSVSSVGVPVRELRASGAVAGGRRRGRLAGHLHGRRGGAGSLSESAGASQDRWMVSYADFMTLLFALFVVLFAASVHSRVALGRLSGAIHDGFGGTARVEGQVVKQEGKGQTVRVQEQPADRTPELREVERELRGALGEAMERHEVALTETREGLVISFEELGFFHSGEANLLPGQAAKVVAAGAILEKHHLVVRVEGHSDDQPIHNAVFASNWELSAARAMTVLLLLVDQTGYDPTRLSMAGYGPYRPIADNATAAGRQRNRRVDLVVLGGRAA